MPDDTLLTDDEIEQIREETLAFIASEGLTKAAAARDAGIPEATFSAFVNGTYAGRKDRFAVACRRWKRARLARKEVMARAPAAPSFVLTPTAEAITDVLQHAHAAADMCVISGPPGIGKTSAACAYTRRTPNVWKIVGHPMLQSPRAAMEELARTVGMPNERGISSLHRAIVQRVRGTGGLIIVDEANHLTGTTLDQLRAIHDEAEIGLALMGNAITLSRMEGGTRAAEFAQLYSRIGMRLTNARDHRARLRGDVDAYLDAWSVEDEATRKLLHAIARKPGALRNLRKTLQLAHLVAGSERSPLDAEHVRLAWQRLSEAPVEAGEAA